MSFYQNLANTSLKLISEKGKNVTLRYVSAGSYDVDNDTVSSTSNTDKQVKAVRTEFKTSEIDGTLIKEDDFKLMIAAKSLTAKPENDDLIVDDQKTYKIKRVKKIAPADVDLVYILHVVQVGV